MGTPMEGEIWGAGIHICVDGRARITGAGHERERGASITGARAKQHGLWKARVIRVGRIMERELWIGDYGRAGLRRDISGAEIREGRSRAEQSRGVAVSTGGQNAAPWTPMLSS
jgi:hypothetical protein